MDLQAKQGHGSCLIRSYLMPHASCLYDTSHITPQVVRAGGHTYARASQAHRHTSHHSDTLDYVPTKAVGHTR